MSGRSVEINFKINFPVVLLTVLTLHVLFMFWKGLPALKQFVAERPSERAPLMIRDIRTVGAKDSKIKDSTYLSKNESKTKKIIKEQVASIKRDSPNLSLSDLAAAPKAPSVRPGTRPEMAKSKPQHITGIDLKGAQMRQFAYGSSSASSGGDSQAATFSNSDVAVNLEVPEGVTPDELNKYELMFYGFQRRTAINYVNSFYKNLNKFQRENPHLHFPMSETKQTMTGRLTYDEKGNIKQIKMIRWTNVERLQEFFLDVLKDMDRLQNPPHALWEKKGEFSIYFSFVVNG